MLLPYNIKTKVTCTPQGTSQRHRTHHSPETAQAQSRTRGTGKCSEPAPDLVWRLWEPLVSVHSWSCKALENKRQSGKFLNIQIIVICCTCYPASHSNRPTLPQEHLQVKGSLCLHETRSWHGLERQTDGQTATASAPAQPESPCGPTLWKYTANTLLRRQVREEEH